MWRDAQLEEHQTTEKRYQIILQAILPILQKWLQLALKHSALSAEQKRQLLELRKKLYKNQNKKTLSLYLEIF